MKNILKYSFSILIMISCLVLFTIMAFKVLILEESPVGKDDDTQAPPSEETQDGEDKREEQNPPQPEPDVKDPKDAPFTAADPTYLSDALFIGDSRTLGLSEYGQVQGADFFANTGMSVYNVKEKTVNFAGIGSVNLDQLLSGKKYGKIYLMLGINELGYNQDNTVQKYKELVDYIREKAPDSLLFIEGNLHVAAARSDSDKVFNNSNINSFNERISQFIDNKKIFYIDVNEIFDDENGNLRAEYTSDNTHILGKYYVNWTEWILTKAIVQ